MKRSRYSKVPFISAAVLGLVLFYLTRHSQAAGEQWGADFLFAMGSGFLIAGLCLQLSNMKMFASFTWGMRFFHRLIRGRARTGREETEDYAQYREQMGGHMEAVPLIIIAVVFLMLSFLTAGV